MCAACLAGSSQALITVSGFFAAKYAARWRRRRANRAEATDPAASGVGGSLATSADEQQVARAASTQFVVSARAGADGDEPARR